MTPARAARVLVSDVAAGPLDLDDLHCDGTGAVRFRLDRGGGRRPGRGLSVGGHADGRGVRPWGAARALQGRHRRRSAARVRVGLFGLLGAGNIGNDASMEVVLRYLRAAHPGAVVDAMGTGPQELSERYGIDAVPLNSRHRHARRSHEGRARQGAAAEGRQLPGVATIGSILLGLGVDAVRTARWVRRHEVVIVPGAGVLEASLPLRPWETPYHLFLLCLAGRLFGTKVALVSVGATMIRQPVTRWLCDAAARLATYRSYRDVPSRDAMARRGLDVTADRIYPDLVFGLPVPESGPGDAGTVGVGVMTYYGTNDDRREAARIHTAYTDGLGSFVGWLVDRGSRVRLFVGDDCDAAAVRDIIAAVQESRPALELGRIEAVPAVTFDQLAEAMAPVGLVVATRFHNVMCALKLGKPVISVGYSAKNEALMASMGMSEFCQSASSLDVTRLVEQFARLEAQAPGLRPQIAARTADEARRLDEQWSELSAAVLGMAAPQAAEVPASAPALRRPAARRDLAGVPGRRWRAAP